jgi:hypothetical protein
MNEANEYTGEKKRPIVQQAGHPLANDNQFRYCRLASSKQQAAFVCHLGWKPQ